MPDRKKVIYSIERCISHVPDACRDCAYDAGQPYNECVGMMLKDALALLQEQEAVEPKQVDLYGKDEWWGLVCVCPDCKAEWMSDKADTHFCPKCGRKVKWE